MLLIFCWTETTLIDRAKGLRSDLQHASNDISSLFTRLGTCLFPMFRAENKSLSSDDFTCFCRPKGQAGIGKQEHASEIWFTA